VPATHGIGARPGYPPLPAETTSFVGRRREINEVRRALGATRLLTLTGPAGVGKTRLALRAAASMRRAFPDGICLVELSELRDQALLGNLVAEQMRLHDQSSRAAVDTVIEHLGARRTLLVLDNCEHLVHACALLVDALVRACPGVHVLATSRQSLRVSGEHIMSIAPLPVPEPDDLTPDSLERYDSVSLFVDRATAAASGFTVSEANCAALGEVCRELDGIPLAIELAAVRLRSLSLNQLRERLAQRFQLLTNGRRTAHPRQRTLQALIDWSYDLCSEQERLVWRRSSVFSGSFDLDAAEYVCGAAGSAATEDILDVVASLVDKSVLLPVPDGMRVRYRQLEIVREYGQRRLDAAGEHAEVRRRHRDWYAGLVARFAADWIGPEWADRLRREHANLRVALDYCASQPGEAVAGLRMATLLDDYWGIRGFHTEARHWLDNGLAAAPDATGERVSALRLAGWYAALQGDIDVGKPLLLEAEELAERLDHVAEGGYVTHSWGMAALFIGDLDHALVLLRDALVRFRAAGVRHGEMFALFSLSLTLGQRGDRKGAMDLIDRSLTITAGTGEMFWRAYALWSLAYTEVLHDRPKRAEAAGREALSMQCKLDNKLAMAFSIDTLAWVAQRRRDPVRAATLFGAAGAVWQQIGAAPECYVPLATSHHDHLDRTRAELGEDRFDELFQHGYRMPAETAVGYALGTTAADPRGGRAQAPQTPLTRRERQIAELVAGGLSNRQIAARLVISQRTAETHVEHILVKLGFSSRSQIAAWTVDRARSDATAG
jgi:predicted ATPase/DNA-binding NarL/FixJ family response regulator